MKPATVRIPAYVLLAAVVVFAAAAWGQVNARAPHVGYVYPAGGQLGTTMEVTVAGQSLRGVSAAYVTGEGVHVSVVKYYLPVRNLMPEQRLELVRQLSELRDKRVAEMGIQVRVPLFPGEAFAAQRLAIPARQAPRQGQAPSPAGKPAAPAAQPPARAASPAPAPATTPAPAPAADAKPVALPDSALLRNLDTMSIRQLMTVAD